MNEADRDKRKEEQRVVSSTKCTVQVTVYQEMKAAAFRSEAPVCCFPSAGEPKVFNPESRISSLTMETVACQVKMVGGSLHDLASYYYTDSTWWQYADSC